MSISYFFFDLFYISFINLMKHKVLNITLEQIDQMIVLKYRRLVTSQDHPAYVSNNTLGKIFGIDGSSVRRLCLKRFEELNDTKVLTRKQKLKQQSLPIRKRYGYRFLSSDHLNFLLNPDII